jgi:hypothetical protein
MIDVAVIESIEALRRAEAESKHRAAEIAELRQHLGESTAEVARMKEGIRRHEHRIESLLADVDHRQRSLDVVVKELSATKEALRQTKGENHRLKLALDSVLERQSGGHVPGDVAPSPAAVLFFSKCFSTGCDPSIGLLRSLFHGGRIHSAEPVSFQQLACLIETLQATPPCGSTAMSLRFEGDECVSLVEDLLKLLPQLFSVEFGNVSPQGGKTLCHLASIYDSIQDLSFYASIFDDQAVSALCKCVHNRTAVATTRQCPPLTVQKLDLSTSTLVDVDVLKSVGWPGLSTLDLSGSAIDHSILSSIAAASPNLTTVSIRSCAHVDNGIATVLNRHPNIIELDIRGTNVTSLQFTHVRRLGADLKATCSLDAPSLSSFLAPLANVQSISWNTPLLESLVVQGAAVDERQMKFLAKCANLKEVSFVNCRLKGLCYLVGCLRKVVHLSTHGSTGVSDEDLLQLPSSLESLDLTDNFALTDRVLVACAACLTLRTLVIKRCTNLTDGGILQLAGSPSLEALNVLGTRRISSIALHRLCSSLPQLKELVHETVLLSSVTVERADQEEAARSAIDQTAKSLVLQRDSLAVTFGASSPMKSPQRQQQ